MKTSIAAATFFALVTGAAQAQDEHAHHAVHAAARAGDVAPAACKPSEQDKSHCPAPSKVPPVTDAMREAAFPDLGGMRMSDHMHADPLLAGVVADRLEWQDADPAAAYAWDLRAWAGHDANRLWLRSEGEHEDGHTRGDASLLWGHAVAPWWDLLAGLRQDFGAQRKRSWAAFGVQGLAPYKVDVTAMVFVGTSGEVALRAEAQYDLLLTQRWVLQPRLETNLYGRADTTRSGSSGRDDIEAGLRLRYEIRREIAPYVGIERRRQFGPGGAATGGTRWLAGLRLTF